MLHFNELKITPDNKNLIIDVSVDIDKYFDNIYIDKVIIDNQDTYNTSGPSSNPIYIKTIEDSVKNTRLILTKQDLLDQYVQPIELDKSIFFVYIIAKGTPDPSTPCGLDSNQIVGVAINLCPFYQATIKYLYELENECQIPKHFIDMILKFIGLESSIKMGNFSQVIKYWNKFFSKINYSPSYICKCNG